MRTCLLPRRALRAQAAALFALTRHAKDLRNSTLFVIRQVLSAYERGQLKETLQPAQLEVLALANRCVDALNAQRVGKKGPDAKLLPRFEAQAQPFQILDVTLLDNVARALPDQHEVNAYRCLPATAAQQVVRDVLDGFKGWSASLKSYAQQPAAFTGRPAMPGYLSSSARAPVSFPWASLSSGRFKDIRGKALFLDYERQTPLSDQDKQALALLSLRDEVLALQQRQRLGQGPGECARPVEVRLIPGVSGETKVEVVFEVTLDVEPAPWVKRLTAAVGDSLTGVAREKAVMAQLAALPQEAHRHLAGADLGLNNVMSVAFGGGQRGFVVSAQRIEARLAHLDSRLDAAISKATPEALRALQARKDLSETLGAADWVRLKQLRAQVHQDAQVQRLRALRQQFLKGVVHRLSSGVIARLKAAGTQVLVVGLNKGWKNGAQQDQDKGRKFNRRNLRIPHALLIEQLRYKAQAAGLLLVTTEESYTSKTSFALNEPLRRHASAQTASSDTGDTRTDEQPSSLQGRRRQHVFTSPQAPQGWARMHADLNGAFNIMRKAALKFRWHAKLSAAYELLWLSPKTGLSPMKLRTA